MDLALLDFAASASKGADVEIIHPVDRIGTGIFFKIIGEDSDEYRQHQLAKADKITGEMRSLKPGQRNKMETLSTEDMMVDRIADNAFLVRGWFEGITHHEKKNEAGVVIEPARIEKIKDTITLNGEELSFTHAKVLELLMKFPVLLEQVREAVKSRALFTPDSAKS
jgi:hypothetical protein